MVEKRLFIDKGIIAKNRYYAVGSALTYLKKEIRNSIIPKNVKDIDMVNCHPVISLYFCEKHGLKCDILKDYVENREFKNHLEIIEKK